MAAPEKAISAVPCYKSDGINKISEGFLGLSMFLGNHGKYDYEASLANLTQFWRHLVFK